MQSVNSQITDYELAVLLSIKPLEICQASDLLGIDENKVIESISRLNSFVIKLPNDKYRSQSIEQIIHLSSDIDIEIFKKKIYRKLYLYFITKEPVNSVLYLSRSKPSKEFILDNLDFICKQLNNTNDENTKIDILTIIFQEYNLIDAVKLIKYRLGVLEIALIYCKVCAESGCYKDIHDMNEYIFRYIDIPGKAPFVESYIEALKRNQKYTEAINVGFDYINELGGNLNSHTSRTNLSKLVLLTKLSLRFFVLRRKYLKLASGEQDIKSLNKSEDLAHAKIWASLTSACYMHPNPMHILELAMDALTKLLTKGFSSESSFLVAGLAFTVLHIIPGNKQKLINSTENLIGFARKLEGKYGYNYKARTDLVDYSFVRCWSEDSKPLSLELRKSFAESSLKGDYEFALYCCMIGSLQAFIRGMPLLDIKEHVSQGALLASNTSQKTTELNLKSLDSLLSHLIGTSLEPTESKQTKDSLKSSDSTVTFVYYFCRSLILLFKHDKMKALENIELAIDARLGVFGQEVTLYALYLYCFLKLSSKNLSFSEVLRVKRYKKKIRKWNHISSTWSHRLYHIEGLLSLHNKKFDDSIEFLNKALSISTDDNYHLDTHIILQSLSAVKNKTSSDLDSLYYIKKSVSNLLVWGAKNYAVEFESLNFGSRSDEDLLNELQQTRMLLLHTEKMNSLGRMSGAFIHEVNNPLNASIQALNYIQTISEDQKILEGITDSLEGLYRIKNIISNLKAFAFTDKKSMVKEIVDISQPIEAALSILRTQLINIKIEKDILPTKININETMICQLIMNLAINSMQAMKVGGYESGVITIKTDTSKSNLYINFMDTFGGVHDPEKIFTPYHTENKEDGIGLGLSIVKNIIKMHDGNIHVENKNKGANFIIELPLRNKD